MKFLFVYELPRDEMGKSKKTFAGPSFQLSIEKPTHFFFFHLSKDDKWFYSNS